MYTRRPRYYNTITPRDIETCNERSVILYYTHIHIIIIIMYNIHEI